MICGVMWKKIYDLWLTLTYSILLWLELIWVAIVSKVGPVLHHVPREHQLVLGVVERKQGVEHKRQLCAMA